MYNSTEESAERGHFGVEPAEWNERYGELLYRYAYSRLGNSDRAEDVVQETFLAALRSRGQYAGHGTEAAWLLGIAKRKIVDHLRHRDRPERYARRSQHAECVVETRLSRRPEYRRDVRPDASLEREELWDALQWCLGELPLQQSEAFQRREIDGQKTGEICEQMRLTPGNLWVSLHRARTRLSRCMQCLGYDSTAHSACSRELCQRA